MNSKKLAILALITASIIWGINGPVMKLTLQSVPIFSLAFIRFFFASLILFPFIYKKLHINLKDLPIFILCAGLGVTFNITFFFWGLTLTTALNSGIIVSTTPMFTLIFAAIFLKEKITKGLIIGSIIGILGIGIIVSQDILKNGIALSPIGDFLILLATLAFIFYEILSKKFLKNYHPLTIIFYAFAIGGVSFLPAAVFEFTKNPGWINNLPSTSIWGIIFGTLFSSIGAYSLWQWGLSKIDESRAGFFFYLDPMASTVAAVILLSEKITQPFVLGAILIFLGLLFAEGRLPYHTLLEHALGKFKK